MATVGTQLTNVTTRTEASSRSLAAAAPGANQKRRHRSQSTGHGVTTAGARHSRSDSDDRSPTGGGSGWIRVGPKRHSFASASASRDPIAIAAAIARRNSGWGSRQRHPSQPPAPSDVSPTAFTSAAAAADHGAGAGDTARHRRFATSTAHHLLRGAHRGRGPTQQTPATSGPEATSTDDERRPAVPTAAFIKSAGVTTTTTKAARRRRVRLANKAKPSSAGESLQGGGRNSGSDQEPTPTPGQMSAESAGRASRPDGSAPSPSRPRVSGGMTLRPVVKCTDGSRTSQRSLRDILHAGGADYPLEADTPVVRPSKAPAAAPPRLSLMTEEDSMSRQPSHDDLAAGYRHMHGHGSSSGGLDSEPGSALLAVPPSAFTVEGIATPNTFYSMPCVAMPPPLPPNRHTYQDILEQWDAASGTFAWHCDAAAAVAFAEQIELLCADVASIMRRQPLMRELSAPAYVLGDIHGNFGDLAFFLRNFLVMNDIQVTPCQILCLGDYVDRGPHGIECIALLFALFLEAPERVVLLRGNHEDRVVCGDRRTYGDDCFWSQCCRRFGSVVGTRLFRTVTRVFRHLPLACEMTLPTPDAPRVLCTHGGFPRFSVHDPRSFERLRLLLRDDFPRFLTLFPNNPLAQEDSGSDSELPDFVEAAWFTAFDLMWSDPTTEDDDGNIDENGFSCNARGMNVMSFSQRAVETFLANTGYSMLFRAHQEKRFGLRLSKSSKVLTLFSSSNYQGHGNSAGCAIVDVSGGIQLVVKH